MSGGQCDYIRKCAIFLDPAIQRTSMFLWGNAFFQKKRKGTKKEEKKEKRREKEKHEERKKEIEINPIPQGKLFRSSC